MRGGSKRHVRDRGSQVSQADTARIFNLREVCVRSIQVISHAIFKHILYYKFSLCTLQFGFKHKHDIVIITSQRMEN